MRSRVMEKGLLVLSQSASGLGGRSGDFAKWILPLTFVY
jgi:hypothetical protein